MGSKIESKPNNRLTYILAGATVIFVVGLGYQYFEIRSLRLQMSENRARLELASRDSAAALATSEDQESRIKMLESNASQTSRHIDPPAIEKLNALQPGLYELATSTQYDPNFEEMATYTITHVVLELQYDMIWSLIQVSG